MLSNSKDQWGWISITLHWLTAVLILGLAMVGLLMTELPNSPFKMQIYAMHKSFGLTVLVLTLLRLAWRFIAGRPDQLLESGRLQTLAAKAVHGALYALLLAMPLSGWLYNSASGFALKWFGLITLPKLFTGFNPTVKAFALASHETLFYILAAVLLIHAGAALWHHYAKHDHTLNRMLGKTL